MKVKELIALLQECDENKEVKIDGDMMVNAVQELFFDNEVILFSAPTEENIEEQADEFFCRLAEELEQANGEYLDACKINGVR